MFHVHIDACVCVWLWLCSLPIPLSFLAMPGHLPCPWEKVWQKPCPFLVPWRSPSRLLVVNSFHIFLSQFHCTVDFLTEAMYKHHKRFNQRFSMVRNCIRCISEELSAFRGYFVMGKNRTASFLPPAVHLGVFCCPSTGPGACRAGNSSGSSVRRLKANALSSQRFLPCTVPLLAVIDRKHF